MWRMWGHISDWQSCRQRRGASAEGRSESNEIAAPVWNHAGRGDVVWRDACALMFEAKKKGDPRVSTPSNLPPLDVSTAPAAMVPQRSFLWALRQAALGLLLLAIFAAAGAWLLDASIDRSDAAQAATTDSIE